MSTLDGTLWRLVDSMAWDDSATQLGPPYGANPIGHISFTNGRMLAALCNGDAVVEQVRQYSSYGGLYQFDGSTLECLVDMASDPSRIGGCQVRSVVMRGEQMLLRPPTRLYGTSMQRRELVWECVWRAATATECGEKR